MLIPVWVQDRLLGIKPKSIGHIGAHELEEFEAYIKYGWGEGKTIWVDMRAASPKVLLLLSQKPNHRYERAVVWNKNGESLPFFEASNGMSSSVLTPKTHTESYPAILFKKRAPEIKTRRLDEIFKGSVPEYLNLDIQGAELYALIGLGNQIKNVKFLYSEFNTTTNYENNSTLDQLDAYLSSKEFIRIITVKTDKEWGDALYVGRNLCPSLIRIKLAQLALFVIRVKGNLLTNMVIKPHGIIKALMIKLKSPDMFKNH